MHDIYIHKIKLFFFLFLVWRSRSWQCQFWPIIRAEITTPVSSSKQRYGENSNVINANNLQTVTKHIWSNTSDVITRNLYLRKWNSLCVPLFVLLNACVMYYYIVYIWMWLNLYIIIIWRCLCICVMCIRFMWSFQSNFMDFYLPSTYRTCSAVRSV